MKAKTLFSLTVVAFLLYVGATSRKTTNREINQINEFYPSSEKDPQWDQKMIEIDQAKKYLKNRRQIVVAVIDTGIDWRHPHLKNKIWTNPGETGTDAYGRPKATNGVDDDRNGFIDDLHGWNFVAKNNNTTDTHGHGTHVSGIIATLAPNTKILPIKYFDDSSSGEDHLKNTISAIAYANAMGANIINYSAGGLSQNPVEKRLIAAAGRKNILFVAAAGNEGANSERLPYYPANYELSNIISVTAINPTRNVLPSSNFSQKLVDIAAPGENIYSSLPGGQYGSLTGTSQATAFVTAIASLLMSHRPELKKPEWIIDYLVKTGEWSENLLGKTKYGTQLNAFYALTSLGADLKTAQPVSTESENPYEKFANKLERIAESDLKKIVLRAPSGEFSSLDSQ